MALALNDRVQQTGTANTTVSFTLSGSVVGFQSFAVVGNGNTTYYSATDGSGNWEVGIGTYSTTGPTLTRTTILSSSNSNTAVTFVGTVNVFVTYPSSKSVNLDGSSNVSALGTVSSGTWQGSTIGVAYGGTGVTSSSGANSVVLRDANQNINVNRVNQSNTNTTAAGGTTALTVASSYIHSLVGAGGQTYTLPDATTLTTGVAFVFNNLATGTLTIQDYATATIGTIPSGGAGAVFLTNNSTVGGTWDLHGYLPEGVTFGTNAFNLGTSVITGGTWQGGTIGTAYGGTGLTTFAAANNALYSTSSSALVAGTLPSAAGGTSFATYTTGDIIYASATNTLSKLGVGTNGYILTVSGGVPTWAAAPAAGVTSFQTSLNGLTPSTSTTGAVTLAGTLGATSGGTGLSTYTTGDILYASATNTLSKLAAGSNGQVLTLASGVPSWASAGGGTTLTNTTFTATSGQTSFSFVYDPALLQGVYRNGVKLDPSDYTASSGTAIVLNTGAITGDNIQAQAFTGVSLGAVVTSIAFGSTGLTPSSPSTGNVTVGGTLAVANGGTGLATLTANNVILGNGTSAPTFVAPSTNGNVLTSNGTTWTSAAAPQPGLGGITVFTSNGTFTIPSGKTVVKVTVIGAGGGGGYALSGSGGGGGGFAMKYLTGLTPGNTLTITVGTGGATSGGTGGSSSVASGTQTITTLTSTGGSGGSGLNASSSAWGGAGGTGSNGDINIAGTVGGNGALFLGCSGYDVIVQGGGGSAALYGPGQPSWIGGTFTLPTNYASVGYGGGGMSGSNAFPIASRAGAGGIVIFEY